MGKAITPGCHVDAVLIIAGTPEGGFVRGADPLPVKQRRHVGHKLVKSGDGRDFKGEDGRGKQLGKQREKQLGNGASGHAVLVVFFKLHFGRRLLTI